MINAIKSYAAEIITEDAFRSFANAMRTNAGLSSSVVAFESSISSLMANNQTLTSGYIDAAPTEVRSVLASIHSVEYSILNANGFITISPTTGTSTGAAPRETAIWGAGVMAMGAMAGALVL
jgi:hypothetical protein